MVIFGPICQVGWLQRVGRRHAARARARGMPRNGPPDAVRISRRISDGCRPCRHWWMALCSLSTGSTATPRRARRRHHQRAGHHQDFLVGERDRLAGLDRREHGLERGGAGRGEQHDVHVGMRGDRRSGTSGAAPSAAPARDARAASVLRRPARAQARAALLAGRERRRRAAVRMRVDDGERALADRAGRAEDGDAASSRANRRRRQVVDGRGEQPAVDAIEDAAVAGDQVRRVLHAGAALEQRLEQIADDAEQRRARRRAARASRAATRRRSGRRPPSPACRTTRPPIAPSTVFFGLIAAPAAGARTRGRCSTAPNR